MAGFCIVWGAGATVGWTRATGGMCGGGSPDCTLVILWATLRRCWYRTLKVETDDACVTDFAKFICCAFAGCWCGVAAVLVGGAATAGAAGWQPGDWRIAGRRDCGSRLVGTAVDSREIFAGCGDGAGLRDGAGPVVADGFAAAGCERGFERDIWRRGADIRPRKSDFGDAAGGGAGGGGFVAGNSRVAGGLCARCERQHCGARREIAD